MTYYGKIFSAATGVTNERELAAIEQCVRDRFSTLDHLSRAELRREGRKAKKIVDAIGVEMFLL